VAKVTFHYADRQLPLNDKKNLRSFIELNLFTNENIALEQLRYIFCSDEYLLVINKQFLNHDDYTDIITFDLSEQGGNGIIGEVYISIDRVKENAATLQNAQNDEVLRVIFHGALHLCGYKDKKPSDSKLMREKENLYIDRYKNKKSST